MSIEIISHEALDRVAGEDAGAYVPIDQGIKLLGQKYAETAITQVTLVQSDFANWLHDNQPDVVYRMIFVRKDKYEALRDELSAAFPLAIVLQGTNPFNSLKGNTYEKMVLLFNDNYLLVPLRINPLRHRGHSLLTSVGFPIYFWGMRFTRRMDDTMRVVDYFIEGSPMDFSELRSSSQWYLSSPAAAIRRNRLERYGVDIYNKVTGFSTDLEIAMVEDSLCV